MAEVLGPVETLRAAAAKLRELAKDATPGPWPAEWFERGDDRERADVNWITAVHPGVAEPLADAMEKVARVVRLDADFVHRVGYAELLTVARVLLGVPDGPQ